MQYGQREGANPTAPEFGAHGGKGASTPQSFPLTAKSGEVAFMCTRTTISLGFGQ